MSTSASRQKNVHAFPPSHSSTHAINGKAAGAVQPPGAPNEHALNATDAKDGIREGKQKAKTVMEAHLSRKRSRSGSRIPVHRNESAGVDPTHDEIVLDRYIQRDSLHGAAMNDQSQRTRDLFHAKEKEKEFYLHEGRQRRLIDPGSVFGYGYAGFGNRQTDMKNHHSAIVYSADRWKPKNRRNPQLRTPRQDAARQAEQHEELVPVRLDIEMDKMRLRDTFTWNLHEKLITPDQFADYLIEDLKLPPEHVPQVMAQVRSEIHEQLQGFYPHIIVEDGPLESGRPYNDHKDDEIRVQIKLNITIGRITLIDQFEWDINNPHNSPEEFARLMAWENALSGEFTTAIAHTIREQSQLYTKSLYLTNHCFDGRPVEDPDVRDSFLPAPILSAFRPQQTQKDWTLYMYEMSEAEMERTELSMMREQRAQKRQLNRRGGPALPDLKDRQRTVRSLIVHSVIPGGVENLEATGILKLRKTRATRGRGRTDGDVDSSDLESEESGAESPAPSAILNSGTARTRGMRGAATAAQVAMRANYAGRSATPDTTSLHPPHETRTSGRRTAPLEFTPGDDTFIVKLRIGKAKYRQWWERYSEAKRAKEFPLSGYASAPPNTRDQATPQPAKTLKAPLTPAIQQQSLPSTGRRTTTPQAPPTTNGHHSAPTPQLQQQRYDSMGSIDTDHNPYPEEQPPPPPPWLDEAITFLRERHPDSQFESIMKFYPIDKASMATATIDPPTEYGAPPPAGIKFQYSPRIRCNDCPGKLYKAMPGQVVENFEVHLQNRKHREMVEKRKKGEKK